MTNGIESETNGITRGTNGNGLLSCPYCGGVDALKVVKSDVRDATPENYFVLCDWLDGGCGASGGVRRTKIGAIAAWNSRAKDAAIIEMAQRIQSLESECAKLQDELRKAGNRGTLTAEQVRDAWCSNLKRDCLYDPPSPDWQAIADELNNVLGIGECEMVTSGTPSEGNTDKRCTACGAYNIGEYYDGLSHIASPKFCPNCGKAVKR